MQQILRAFPVALLLAVAPAAIPATAEAAEPFTEEQQRELDKRIHDYIMNNPRVILDAVQRMQAEEENAKRELAKKNLVTFREQLINDPNAPVTGNPNGDVTLVEFFDYRCGFCKRVSPVVEKAISEDGNLRVLFKEFPILGPESVTAARASLAVWRLDPEKYMDFHYQLMSERGSVSDNLVLSIAENVGLDRDLVAREMKSPEIETDIRNNHQLAQALGISGTPAFVIGSELVPGAVDLDTLKGLISEARGG